MKIFRIDDGRVLQLADKEIIKSWEPAMPLIYIGDIRDNRLPKYKEQYPPKILKQIEAYLEEILEEVAIPKLIGALQSENDGERLRIAKNFVQISESNADQLKIALPHIKKAIETDKKKEIISLMKNTLTNYKKAQKKKQTAKKRVILRKLTREMTDLDREYADGKTSDADYLKRRKEFVKLKREIEIEEQVD